MSGADVAAASAQAFGMRNYFTNYVSAADPAPYLLLARRTGAMPDRRQGLKKMYDTHDNDRESSGVIALGGIGAAIGAALGALGNGMDTAFAGAIVGATFGALIGAWLGQRA
jgi:membrane associated rhomboid family serine protease